MHFFSGIRNSILKEKKMSLGFSRRIAKRIMVVFHRALLNKYWPEIYKRNYKTTLEQEKTSL